MRPPGHHIQPPCVSIFLTFFLFHHLIFHREGGVKMVEFCFCAQVVQPAQRKPEPVIFHFLERSQEIGREEIQIEWTMKHICWEWNAKNWNANVTIQWKWSVPSNHLELQRMGGVTLEIVETQLNTMLEWKIKTKLTFRFKWKPQTIFEFKAYNWDKKLNEIWSWIEQLNLRLKFKKCI